MVAAGFGVRAQSSPLLEPKHLSLAMIFSARHKVRSHPGGSVVRAKRRDMLLSVVLASYTTFIGVDTFLARHFFSATVAGRTPQEQSQHIRVVPRRHRHHCVSTLGGGRGTSVESRRVFIQALRSHICRHLTAARSPFSRASSYTYSSAQNTSARFQLLVLWLSPLQR